MLDKQGKSNGGERMDLLDRLAAIFPDAQIACVTGDREFISKEWLFYLLMDSPTPFRLQIRVSDNIASALGLNGVAAARLFANLKVGETRLLSHHQWVWKRPVYVVCTRLEPNPKDDDAFLIVITNVNPDTAITDYYTVNLYVNDAYERRIVRRKTERLWTQPKAPKSLQGR